MGEGDTRPSTIQNTLFAKTGKYLSRLRIRNLTNYHSRSIINGKDYEGLFDGKKTSDCSNIDLMVMYCKKHGYQFQLLVHDPIFHYGPVSETYLNKDENPIVEKINDFNQKELSGVLDNIANGRYSRQCLATQKYMMAFAWIIPDELHLLESFGHVIFIDTTEKTNDEK